MAAAYYGVQSWTVTVTETTFRGSTTVYYFQIICTDDDPAILGCMELLLTGLFNTRKYTRTRQSWSSAEWLNMRFVTKVYRSDR